MQPESIIKGRTAGLIVSLMLQEAGYLVFRFGYEGLPESLVQLGNLKKTHLLRQLASIPHFVLVDKTTGDIQLLTIKYQGQKKSGRSIPWGASEILQYWPDTLLIIVGQEAPYFSVSENEAKETLIKQVPLEKYKGLKLSPAIIKKYGLLAHKICSF